MGEIKIMAGEFWAEYNKHKQPSGKGQMTAPPEEDYTPHEACKLLESFAIKLEGIFSDKHIGTIRL